MSNSRARALTWPYPRQRHFEQQMRRIAAKWFADRDLPANSQYPFILAEYDNWGSNIILPEVVEFIGMDRAEREQRGVCFPLHKYIHHGLSSQAMVFNLIGPLIVRHDLEPLRIALEPHGLVWPDSQIAASFEYEDRLVFNEDAGQPTSLDVVIEAEDSGPFLFIESKFVEKEFGGCSVFADGDCDGRNPASDFSACYLHHLGRKYWDLLQKHGFLEGPLGSDSTCVFTTHYQFFREILFALELNGNFVLLADERNPTFYCDGPNGPRGLIPFLTSLIPPAARQRVIFLSIQQLVAAIRQTGRHEWIAAFEEKYGLS